MKIRPEIKSGMQIIYVDHLDDVLKHVFAGPEPRGRAAGPRTPRAKAAAVKPAKARVVSKAKTQREPGKPAASRAKGRTGKSPESPAWRPRKR